jgi:hypothetical protein
VIYQDAPDHLRRHAEEVRAVLPPDMLLVNETQVRFVYQGGTLQGVVRPFAPQIPRGQPAQFSVNERCQPVERLLIAIAPADQQFGNALL